MLFFDRNVAPPVVKALKLVREDVIGHDELFAHNARDEDIATTLSPLGHTWITRDKRLMTRPRQRRVMLDAQLQIFVNTDGGNLRIWDFFQLLVRRLPSIEEKISEARPGIYVYTASTAPMLRYWRNEHGVEQSSPRTSGATSSGGRLSSRSSRTPNARGSQPGPPASHLHRRAA